eukprot:SAG25_NODE_5664_length_633_cov_1.642322_2_plen_61_part_01
MCEPLQLVRIYVVFKAQKRYPRVDRPIKPEVSRKGYFWLGPLHTVVAHAKVLLAVVARTIA